MQAADDFRIFSLNQFGLIHTLVGDKTVFFVRYYWTLPWRRSIDRCNVYRLPCHRRTKRFHQIRTDIFIAPYPCCVPPYTSRRPPYCPLLQTSYFLCDVGQLQQLLAFFVRVSSYPICQYNRLLGFCCCWQVFCCSAQRWLSF